MFVVSGWRLVIGPAQRVTAHIQVSSLSFTFLDNICDFKSVVPWHVHSAVPCWPHCVCGRWLIIVNVSLIVLIFLGNRAKHCWDQAEEGLGHWVSGASAHNEPQYVWPFELRILLVPCWPCCACPASDVDGRSLAEAEPASLMEAKGVLEVVSALKQD